MGALLVAGTSSDAGKSVVAAGLCRWLARSGVSVAPFKAQNMSLNSFVTRTGAEIGRAQAAQARACGIEPEAVMNPVLLKPGSDTTSQLIVLGRAVGEQDAAAYWTGTQRGLLDVVTGAFADLRARFDVVICEGAGSPAEINLRHSDIANMGFARAAGIPVVLVGDIDRGGVFASLTGTLAVLEPADQALIAGFIANKFRGDLALLQPGLRMLERLTGRPVLGVLPYTEGIGVDAEDAIDWSLLRSGGEPLGDDVLRVGVVALPRMSNHTDVDALAVEPGVVVRFARHAAELSDADLVVLPGTRSTVADLAWLRERGFDQAISRHAAAGRAVLGICGGYQMLGRLIEDQVESKAGTVSGLGLLPVRTTFGGEKVLGRPVSTLPDGSVLTGYEIHYGVVTREAGEPLSTGEGCVAGPVTGTIWHGLLENDQFRRDFLRDVARSCGRRFTAAPDTSFEGVREARLDRLADLVAANLDTGLVRRLLDGDVGPAGTLRLTLGPAPESPVSALPLVPALPLAPALPPLPALPRRTERLVLRPFRPGDEADVLAYRRLPHVIRYMLAEPMDAGGAITFVAERAARTAITPGNDRISLAVEHDGRVIGEVVIKAGPPDERQAEIGWAFSPDYHGRGLATEAARAVLEIVFGDLGMRRAWAQLDPRNQPSARLCERIGMRHEAHLVEHMLVKGEWTDTSIYALLAREYQNGSGAVPSTSI